MKKILVVDDEVQILKAFTRMFMETDYKILTAENGKEALDLLENNEIDMVISDMRMPLMDGYQLLNTVKEKYPRIIRIILSGYADEKPMFRALLHNVAKLFVFKPWKNEEFLQIIHKLFEVDQTLNSDLIKKTIDDLACSTAMPEHCNKMIELTEAEDLDGLIAHIEACPDLSDLLIQVSKKAVYGVMPNTVKQAAMYIGLNNLKTFIHWACIASNTKQTDNISEEPEPLWLHSYYTNRIFLFLYETFLHKQPPEGAMFVGLMHNIGLIMLTGGLQKQGKLKAEDISLSTLSTLEQGDPAIAHPEIGAYFLNQWDLPFMIYEGALYHHKPLDSLVIHRELVCAVHVAQAYAWKALNSSGHNEVSEDVFETLGISKSDFETRLNRYLKTR